MLRMAFAGIIGAVAAIAVAFLIVAVLSAAGGVPVMYEPDRADYGWEGAQIGMLWFVALGIMLVWPFPAIALAGATIGVVVGLILRKRAAASEASAPNRQVANETRRPTETSNEAAILDSDRARGNDGKRHSRPRPGRKDQAGTHG